MSSGEAYTASPQLEGIGIGARSDKMELAGNQVNQNGLAELRAKLGEDLFQRITLINNHGAEVRKRNIRGVYWYFWMLDVDPSFQGQGHGAKLLKELLARVDEQRLPCFLETRNSKLETRNP